ncbi:MAG TPA: sulfatase [Prolixibacteraceae bacterium]|nr:sulfatase [Prolixibacteraceae bacterium]
MKKRSLPIFALSLFTLVLLKPIFAVENTPASKQNIVFIAIEDFSPKHFGCYGGKAITPNIDALAKEGVIFKNAFCQAPVCNPSRTSLLTGLRPPSSGVFGNSHEWKKMALPKIPATMPQHFKNNGYDAVKVGKLFHYQMEHPESWSRELKTPVEGRKILGSYSAEVIPLLNKLAPVEGGGYFASDLQWGPIDCEPGEFSDGHYATVASDFLSEEHEKPFFLAIGFHAPHVKFAAPKQFFDLYDVNEIELPDNPPNDLEDIPTINDKNIIHSVLDSSQWRDIKRAQFACISYVDWCIGQVVQAIKANDLAKNTAIAIWTDHGFLLGEHFQWSKGGNKLFEETDNVGFIWKVPGITPKGIVSESVVETIDIFPTFFEICNIPVPEHVEGKSFVSLLKNPSMPWKKAGYTWGTPSRVSIQTERYRLNTNTDLNPEYFELYDHKYDPKEYINLSCNPQYAPVIDSLLSYYQQHKLKYSKLH